MTTKITSRQLTKEEMQQLSKEEMQVLGYLGKGGYYEPSGFVCKLIDAMFSADSLNLVKLEREYPGLSRAVWQWRFGTLAIRVGVE